MHNVYDFHNFVDSSDSVCRCHEVKTYLGIHDLGSCGHICIPCCNVPMFGEVLPRDSNYKTCCIPSGSFLVRIVKQVAEKIADKLKHVVSHNYMERWVTLLHTKFVCNKYAGIREHDVVELKKNVESHGLVCRPIGKWSSMFALVCPWFWQSHYRSSRDTSLRGKHVWRFWGSLKYSGACF